MRPTIKPVFLGIAVLLGWFGIILQLDLSLINRQVPVLQMLIRFFSYFTILSNMLVAVCFSAILFAPGSSWGRFFSSNRTLTAITVYIIIVGAIYNVILRPLSHPEGLSILTDEILHTLIPLLTVLYWILFVPKEELRWKDFWPWLIFPLFYICVILLAGTSTQNYPYPFIDVVKLGYPRIFINCLWVAAFFTGLSLLMIAVAKLSVRKKSGL